MVNGESLSGQVGDKSSRRHPSRRQVESATSNSATTAVNSATTAVKSATNALVKSATMIENGNNESLKLRYHYHDGPNTFVFSFYFICNSYKFWVTVDYGWNYGDRNCVDHALICSVE